MRRRILPIVAAVAVIGCGDDGGQMGAAEVVKQWGDAINARDWDRACKLSADGAECRQGLRRDFDGVRLTFTGPAVQPGLKPGEEYFSFGGSLGTVFVTAVPRGETFVVRVNAIVEPASGAAQRPTE